jgi:DNA-binding XRE family transcriptional regulator
LKTLHDVKRAAAALSTQNVDKKKLPRGHKATHGVAKKEIAEALGVSTMTIVKAEQHAATAEAFPFMQGEKWRTFHRLSLREDSE